MASLMGGIKEKKAQNYTQKVPILRFLILSS
jgi:hypothetical protein